jgi:hypothetical protein
VAKIGDDTLFSKLVRFAHVLVLGEVGMRADALLAGEHVHSISQSHSMSMNQAVRASKVSTTSPEQQLQNPAFPPFSTPKTLETVQVGSDADLSLAELRSANMSGANFSGAVLKDADISGANLANAKHLTQQMLNQAYTRPTEPPTLDPGLTPPPRGCDTGQQQAEAPSERMIKQALTRFIVYRNARSDWRFLQARTQRAEPL